MGLELFAREISGVTPTLHAHEIAADLSDHIDYIDRFLAADRSTFSKPRRITIGSPREVMTQCVLPALAADVGRLPRLAVSFNESRALLDDLEAGKFDMVISTIRPRHPDMMGWPIWDEEFRLVASPRLKISTASVSELSKTPLVAYNRDLAIIRRFWNTVYGAEPCFDAAITLPDLLAVKEAAISGFGMTVLPDYLVRDEIADGRLVRIDTANEPPMNTVFLVSCRPALKARKTVASIAALITERVRQYQLDQDTITT
jgi:DNA-binding transcriptional LysR family regulator